MNKLGVILLAFGEPEGSDPGGVVDFLERIFLANSKLEPGAGPQRARELAEARAPELTDAYRVIGGSPMNAHAHRHAEALTSALATKGHSADVFVGTQFTTPTISDALERCREAGVDRLVALPLYPVSGPTTTLAALQTVRDELENLQWSVDTTCIGGWHRHADYINLRAEDIRTTMTLSGVDPSDPGVMLYFSAHGTPTTYLREGSRYQEYVEDSCRLIAKAVGMKRYAIGYQNHTNRGVAWTEPSNETLIPTLDAERLVVVPLSFIHEQSETLDDLDIELKELVEELGMAFDRVPTPHAHPRIGHVLADLVIHAVQGVKIGPMVSCTCQQPEEGLCATRSAAMSAAS